MMFITDLEHKKLELPKMPFFPWPPHSQASVAISPPEFQSPWTSLCSGSHTVEDVPAYLSSSPHLNSWGPGARCIQHLPWCPAQHKKHVQDRLVKCSLAYQWAEYYAAIINHTFEKKLMTKK